MPTKKRWTLIPRKWFGAVAHAAQKRERDQKLEFSQVTGPSIATGLHRLTGRNKTKVEPISSIDENNSINAVTTFTQLQLPAFNVRRGKISTVLPPSSLSMNRKNNYALSSNMPSIRRNGQLNEPLSIYRTRPSIQRIVHDTPHIPLKASVSSPRGDFREENLAKKQFDSRQTSSNQFSKKSLSLTRTYSSSSSMENNESSSSGVFSDERTNSNDRHRLPSKDTLSTLEILSTESLVDSRTSFDQCRPHSPIRRYRLSIPSFETMDQKSTQLQNPPPTVRFHRVQSAEGIQKENLVNRPIAIKNRQSSAAIIKKIEKRISTNRSPTTTTTTTTALEKTNFVRIANDTYRLSNDRDTHLYRRQRPNSIISHSICDDSLPSANNEDCYAQLPRTTSTEQLENSNLQHNLRAIVDDCLRPIVASIDQTTYQPTKTHHYSKRSHAHHEHTDIIIEDITDKLLSSLDSSIYAQYQRCC